MRGCERLGRVRPMATCLMAAVLLAPTACSDDGLGKRYPVTGTVTYKGTPLEKGQINFLPTTPEGRAASGDVEGGSYRLTTLTHGDGALPGKYRVTVIAKDVDLSKVIEQAQGGIPHQRDVLKANQSAKRLTPARYEDAESSGLEAEVKPQSNTFDFPLTE